MQEKIYTIPINEAFDECIADNSLGCPFCRIYKKLENTQIDLALGASMMEPDTRIQTNHLGFCHTHFDMMSCTNNKLSLGLILESHLNEIISDLEHKDMGDIIKGKGNHIISRIDKLEKSCYICNRLDMSMDHIMDNAAVLWSIDKDFRDKTAKQPMFCLHHLKVWSEYGKRQISKKQYNDFYNMIFTVTINYLKTLSEDVSWFCKKFDYRYDNEPWGNSKDSIERSISFLKSDIHSISGK